MAKTRSGLGRGLGSLLGDVPEGVVRQDPIPAPPAPTEQVEKAPAEEPEQPAEEIVEEEIYSNKEDNVTIKGVVERVVAPPTTLVKEEDEKQEAPEPVAEAEQAETEVNINLVEPNPNQPRTSFKKEELEELANSIKKNGLLQPILVRKVGNKYQIIAGERRWQACKSLNMKTVPVRVKDVSDDETIILALVENIQRSDLNPIEEAYGYRRMMERGKMTQSEVAQAVSKGRSTIANALRLLELPEDAQQLLFEEKITAGHARAILSIPTKEGRRKLTDKLVEQNLSVREAENMARLLSGAKKKDASTTRVPQPKSYKTVARTLRDTLKTDVKIRTVAGKNKIEIEFKDETDLERLFRLITNN